MVSVAGVVNLPSAAVYPDCTLKWSQVDDAEMNGSTRAGPAVESIVRIASCSTAAVPLSATVAGDTRKVDGAGAGRTVRETGTVTGVYPAAEATIWAA